MLYALHCACSAYVTPRRPLGRDIVLDSEVESDQEWEEEPEGESLSVSGRGPGGARERSS